MAKFKKGNPGRPKGAKNKKPLAKKEELERLFNENGGFKKLFDIINEIEEPKDKAASLVKVMKFFMAEHKTVEHTSEDLNYIAQVTFTSTATQPITNENDLFDDD